MANQNGTSVTLRDYIDQRLEALGVRIESSNEHTREQIGQLLKEWSRVRTVQDSCRARCDIERGKIWDVIDEWRAILVEVRSDFKSALTEMRVDLQREIKEKAEEDRKAFESATSIFWAKVAGLAAAVYSIITFLQYYVQNHR